MGSGLLFKGEVVDVPAELAELDQWVCWKLVTRRGKTTKQPFTSRGRPASVTDPTDWCSLDVALRGQERHHLDGIGFVFTADDPYCGVDLDHCVDEQGNVHPAAFKMVVAIGSYAEFSPSKTGIHCIVRAEVGKGVRTPGTEWGGNFEAYDRERYFTMTGDVLEGFTVIRESAITINLVNEDDEKIIQRCTRNSKDFPSLFMDDPEEYSADLSAGDMALANILAARTQDSEQIERIMRRSSRLREKWDHPLRDSTWLRETIDRAIRDSRRKKNDDRSVESLDFETEVERGLFFAAVRDEVNSRRNAISAEEAFALLPPAGWTVTDDLNLNEPAPPYVIKGLQMVGHNALLVAKHKLGKTTLTLNLAKSLCTGDPFLGHFDVSFEEGNIAVWNYELMREQWNDWVRQMDFPTDRLVAAHFRGKGIVPLWNKETQKYVADWLLGNNIKYWIIDPTMKAWTGLLQSEGDNVGAGKFLDAIDDIKEQANVPSALLSHHTGRGEEAQERARGATRLDDWRDVGWVMSGIRDHIDFAADGRGVELDKIRITYNEKDKRSFSTDARASDEAEKSSGAHGAIKALAELEDAEVPLEERKTSAVMAKMTGSQDARKDGIQQAINNGWIKREEGARKALLCTLTKTGRRRLEKDE